jgi:hypothetical protein
MHSLLSKQASNALVALMIIILSASLLSKKQNKTKKHIYLCIYIDRRTHWDEEK